MNELGIPSSAKTVLGWFKSKVFYIKELTAIAEYCKADLNTLIIS